MRTESIQTGALEGGFDAPPFDAARAFRAALDAMARPGAIRALAGAQPPAPLSVAAGVLCLTLLDAETPVWLAPALRGGDLIGWLTFHTGAPVTAEPAQAAFAIGRWEALADQGEFPSGTPAYPDRSVTLIVETDALEPRGARLTGPGIATEAALSLPDLRAARDRAGPFPQGVDIFLTAGDRVAALPRSTRIG